MPKLDREGRFRAEVARLDVKRFDSGAVKIEATFNILAKLEGEEWVDWQDSRVQCYGDVWIVNKKDELRVEAVENLAVCWGWDGKFDKLQPNYDGDWVPDDCQITVEAETYTGKDGNERVSYKAAWINPFESTPKSKESATTPSDMEALVSSFENMAMALCANKSKTDGPLAPTAPGAELPV